MKVNKSTKAAIVKIMKDTLYKAINNIDLTPYDREQINRQIFEADFMQVLTDDIIDALVKAQGVETSSKDVKKKENPVILTPAVGKLKGLCTSWNRPVTRMNDTVIRVVGNKLFNQK